MKLPPTMEEKLKAIRNTDTYQALPITKRKFVIAFVESGGDKIKAGYAISDTVKTDAVAQQRAYKLLKDPVVISLLRTFSDPGLQEPLVTDKELLQMASQRLRDLSTSTTDFLRLTELYQSLTAKKPRRKHVTIDEAVLAAEKTR
jgi:hypothetical protein